MEKRVHRLTFFHPKIEKIANCFEKCYIVGGFLRDRLLGIKKNLVDVDLVTYGDFEKEIDCVSQKLGKEPFCFKKEKEVCSFAGEDFRIDVSRGTVPIEEDLKKRDFTINALAVDLNEVFFPFTDSVVLIDPTGGLEDLERGLIRPAYESSISDDPVRILRGVRLKFQLKFNYHSSFVEQSVGSAEKITECPPERIKDELVKILSLKDSYSALADLEALRVLDEIFPEISEKKGNLELVKFLENLDFNAKMEFFSGFNDKSCLKLAALYWGVDASLFKKRLLKLRFGEKAARFGFAVLNGSYELCEIYKRGAPTRENVYRFFRTVRDYFSQSLILFAAAQKGNRKVRDFVEKVFELCEEFKNLKPLLSGKEIMEIKGYSKPNRCIGEIKEKLLYLQATGKVKTKEEAVSFVKEVKCENAN